MCFHPGPVHTAFGRGIRLFEIGLRLPAFRSPEQGADTLRTTDWSADQATDRRMDRAADRPRSEGPDDLPGMAG